MTEIVNLLQDAIFQNEEYSPIILKALEEQQLLQNINRDSTHQTVAKINSLLNNQETRNQAFVILLEFLPECDLDVLNERGLVWLSTTIKACSLKSSSDSTAKGFDVIRLLIERSIEAHEFHKQISHSIIQKIFEAAYDPGEAAECNAINCVNQCMISYPGPSGPSKNIVEKIAFKYIDSSNTELVRGAAISLLLMQQTRSGGEAKVMHEKYFTEYHVQIIGSLHYYCNILFENVDENYDVDQDSDEEKLKLPDLRFSHEPVSKTAQLSQRIINLLIFLREAISGPYSVEKVIRPHQILGVLKRVMDVNPKSIMQNVIVDNLVLAAFLPQIHVQVFEVLNAFTEELQGNVRLFCNDILSLYESSFKWTSTCGKQLGSKKPYSNVRISAYISLKQYCLLLGKGSLMEQIAETIIENIIEDTLPYKSEVTLQSNGVQNKGLSKRAKKKLQKAQNESSNLAQTHSTKQTSNTSRCFTDEHNTELCASALTALSAFLYACGYAIKPTLQRTLQQHIVQLCLKINLNSMEKSNLYFSEDCRKTLYEALTSLILFPHHLSPPPLQYAVEILSNSSLLDPDINVRETCRYLMASIEKIINPTRKFPFFSVSEEEFKNAIKELTGNKTNEFAQQNDKQSENTIINLEEDEEAEEVKENEIEQETITMETVLIEDEKQVVEEKENSETETNNQSEIIDVEMNDESCMVVENTENNKITAPKRSDTAIIDQNITQNPLEELGATTEKRRKIDEEDILVNELAETFVDE
uniref:CSON007010 protein n=1 Tax=Culicoides sonorensis TaxID=179676 RepID=A0A336MUC4_CULSO